MNGFTKAYVWAHVVLWPFLIAIAFVNGLWAVGLLFAVSFTLSTVILIRDWVNRSPRLCHHRSHRLKLPCLRLKNYGGYCPWHNTTCFHHDCERS